MNDSGFLHSLSDYLEDARRGAESFTVAYPHPVLLHTPHDVTASDAFITRTGVEERDREPADQLARAVLAVRKRPGNAYPDVISIGRAPLCDIVLPYHDISKLHAHLTWNRDRSVYRLTDDGSTNRTFLNGRRLEPQDVVPIADRDTLAFGAYAFEFMLPMTLFELLASLGERS